MPPKVPLQRFTPPRTLALLSLLFLVLQASGQAPPSSPPPGSPWKDASQSFEQRARQFLAAMTVEEKLGQLNSQTDPLDRLGLPAFNYWTGCAHGVADFSTQGATIFPMPLGLAATFDQPLMLEIASIIGDEARAKANAAHAKDGSLYATNCFDPNINIYRDPRWGRGAETFGEDPFLTAAMVIAYVRGVQWGSSNSSSGALVAQAPRRGVNGSAAGDPRGFLKAGVTCKHFAAYSLEEAEGVTRMGFDAVVDPRDLQETYLPAFEACVREGVGSVMCSYNAVNGTPACANDWLLHETLRQGWQFGGFVVSDCGAIEAISDQHAFSGSLAEGAAAALKAGTDLGCFQFRPYLNQSLAQGLVSQQELDAAVLRLLVARFRQGHFDYDATVNPWVTIPASVVGQPSHLAKAREAAAKSIVLLKNGPRAPSSSNSSSSSGGGGGGGTSDGGGGLSEEAGQAALPTLPLQLSELTNITVVGPLANQSELLLGNYYGNPAGQLLSPWEALQKKVAAWNAALTGQGAAAGGRTVGLNLMPGADVVGGGALVDEVATACRASDVCIFFLGTSMISTDRTRKQRSGGYDVVAPATEGETWDRHDLLLPGEQLSLVQGAAKRSNATIVVVLVHGGPLDVSWLEQSDRVGAILTAWFPGQGAEAIPDVLFGDTSPSGRLPVTFPFNNYTEQISLADMHMRPWPGRTHRYIQVPVLYPFGHGLSYARFGYSFQIKPGPDASRTARGAIWLSVAVNTTHLSGPPAEDAVLLFVSRQLPPQQQGQRDWGADLLQPLLNLTAACQPDAAGQGWAGQPVQVLVGFYRIALADGRSGIASFSVTAGNLGAFGSDGSGQPPCGRYWLRADDAWAAVDVLPLDGTPSPLPPPSPAPSLAPAPEPSPS